MKRRDFFKEAYEADTGVRFMVMSVRVSRVLELGVLRQSVNQRIAKIDSQRSQELSTDAVVQIAKNLLKAKIAKRIQSWKIRPYSPKLRKGSPTPTFHETHIDQGTPMELALSAIYRENDFRMGSNPSILIPGFIPDGNEAFFLLRKSFLKHGPVFYVNYPNQHFHKETIFHQIYDTIRDLNRRRIKSAGQRPAPFLVGTSFGCRMILSFLNWLRKKDLRDSISIKGLVLLSPVLCLEDIVDVTTPKQRTLVGRAVSHLFEVDPNNHDEIAAAMKKARSIFVKMFVSGSKNLDFKHEETIPILAIEDDVLRIFDETFAPDSGFFQRYLGLKHESPLETEFLSDLPTLVLFAEGEGDVLAPNSPTFATLSNISQLQKIFPNGRVEVVYSLDSRRRVTHSDLIFQARRYSAHLDPWLAQQVS